VESGGRGAGDRSCPPHRQTKLDFACRLVTRNRCRFIIHPYCDPHDRDELCVKNPCLIIEVLSPSTASVDRREKRTSYATLISLREYIIVEQDRMRVELYRRESRGWEGYILSQSDDFVELSCLVLRLTLSEIYEGIELPSGVEEPEPEEYAV
jgi:hypothetical protein